VAALLKVAALQAVLLRTLLARLQLVQLMTL